MGSGQTGKRELVIFVAGGAMRGVFSAGVLKALAGLGVHERVNVFYGISAGAFNVAHFALGTAGRLEEWYIERVPNAELFGFQHPVEAFRHRSLIDMKRAAALIEKHGFLDAKALADLKHPVRFGVVEMKTKDFAWLDARRPDALDVLLATTMVYPFTGDPVPLDGTSYIDGGYAENVCYDALRAKHPRARIIIVMNAHDQGISARRVLARGVVRLRDKALADRWLERASTDRAELARAKKDPNTIVIMPAKTFRVSVGTLNEKTLRTGYNHGLSEVERLRERIETFCV